MFTMKFDIENSVFEGEGLRKETVRILREWAQKIEAGEWVEKFRTIHDINGNDVGRIKLTTGGEA